MCIWRLISVLPFQSKPFEKCLIERLQSFLNKFSIVSEYQFGFMNGKSTGDALTSLTNSFYATIDNKKTFNSCHYRLSETFDTVNHRRFYFAFFLQGRVEVGI